MDNYSFAADLLRPDLTLMHAIADLYNSGSMHSVQAA